MGETKRIFKVTIYHENYQEHELVIATDDMEARRIVVKFDQTSTLADDGPDDVEPVLFCEVEYIGTPLAS